MPKPKLYGAEWCTPCGILKVQLAKDGYDFEFVDIDKNMKEAREARVMGIPTLILPNGDRATGPGPIHDLIKKQ